MQSKQIRILILGLIGMVVAFTIFQWETREDYIENKFTQIDEENLPEWQRQLSISGQRIMEQRLSKEELDLLQSQGDTSSGMSQQAEFQAIPFGNEHHSPK